MSTTTNRIPLAEAEHIAVGLLRRSDGTVVPVPTESELFRLIGLRWVDPRDREVKPCSP